MRAPSKIAPGGFGFSRVPDVFFHDEAVFINVIAVFARDMVLIFLNHAVFAGRSLVTLLAGRNVRFPNEMFAFVKIGTLFVEMNHNLRRAFEMIGPPISPRRMRRRERGSQSIREKPAWRFQIASAIPHSLCTGETRASLE